MLLSTTLLACSRDGSPSAPIPGSAPGAPDAPAARIVSLVPSFTEMLTAIGAADRVVGIGRYDPEVPGHPDLPRVGDTQSVDLETLITLRPDVVLVNAVGLEQRLAPVAGRMRVERIPNDRLEEALAAVGRVAAIAGREQAGRDLVERLRRAIGDATLRAAARAAAGTPAPRVLVVVQRRPLYTAGAGSYLDDLLCAAGAVNVAGGVDEPWPVVSEEAVVAWAPDVILDASLGDTDTAAGRAALLAGWERYPTIPAVRDGRVVVLTDDVVFRAGPRIPEALALLERLLFRDTDAPEGER